MQEVVNLSILNCKQYEETRDQSGDYVLKEYSENLDDSSISLSINHKGDPKKIQLIAYRTDPLDQFECEMHGWKVTLIVPKAAKDATDHETEVVCWLQNDLKKELRENESISTLTKIENIRKFLLEVHIGVPMVGRFD